MELHLNNLPKELVLPKAIRNRSPPAYFSLPTTMAAVGSRGSGKTYNFTLWNKWMFDNLYFTRFFVLSGTYESNPPLHILPTNPADVYTNLELGIEALHEIESKVIKDAEFHHEMTKIYPREYKKWLDSGKNVRRVSPSALSYLKSKQKIIAEYLKSLIDEIALARSNRKPINLASEWCLDHSKIPKRQDFLDILQGTRQLFEDDDTTMWFFEPIAILRPQPLLFIDDASHSPVYSTGRNNPLVNMTLRHRHMGGEGYGLSIQFAVQTFKTGVPKPLRGNTMQFLLFKTQDMSVLENIYEELGGLATKEDFLVMYERAVIERHDFLLVDVNASSPERAFRRGWDSILLPDEDAGQGHQEMITRLQSDKSASYDNTHPKKKTKKEASGYTV